MKEFEALEGQKDIAADDAFRLAATYGFPIELTVELAGERGQQVDVEGYRREMDKHREISRGSGEKATAQRAADFAQAAGFATEFVGYAEVDAITQLGALEELGDGTFLAKLRESPFYPAGGGQVTDHGWIELDDDPSRARRAGRGVPLRRRPGARVPRQRLRGRRPRQGEGARGPSASRRRRTTPRRTSSTRRSARCSATTSSRRARPCGPTSSASTSRTRSRSRPSSARGSSSASTRRSSRTSRCTTFETPIDEARKPRRDDALRREVRRHRARRRRSRATRPSSAAARTCARPPRSAASRSSPRARSARGARRIEAVTSGEAFALPPRARRTSSTQVRAEIEQLRKELKRKPAAETRRRRRSRPKVQAGRTASTSIVQLVEGSTAMRCSTSPTASSSSTRRRRSCSAPPATAAVSLVANFDDAVARADQRRPT